MKKPNLFIVGAAKAGTTSIYKYLSEHPDIYMSPIKEPNFFGSDISWEDFRHDYKINTQLDFDKYFSKKKLIHKHIAFIEDINLYMKLFRNGEDFKILGEASTSYLYSKLAAKEIYKFNPTAKIIIILRDPLERTISHYLMDYSSKKYKTKNILEDLKKDFYSSKKGYGITNLYIDLSLYSEQILRYIKIFPKKQLLFLNFEDIKENQNTVMSNLFDFIEVENIEIENKNSFNTTKEPKNVLAQKLYSLKWLFPRVLKSLINTHFYNVFFKQVSKNIISNETIDFINNQVKNDRTLVKKILNQFNK
jgi:hypothetical protein